jgi:predicted transcriptional regulator
MHDKPREIVSPCESAEVEELQAVLRIKNQLIQSLTFERDDLEKRFKEIGQKYLDLLGRHEALRHEVERMPSLEELVKMQTKIMSLEQQLKLCRRHACAQPFCDGRSAVDAVHHVDAPDKA